jgi:hypothetical protein
MKKINKNMKSKKVKKKVHKKMPPHKNEPHPLASRGEVNKTFVIAAITIVALVVISLLLLFTDTFVGKAIGTVEAPSGEAGIFITTDESISTSVNEVVPITASLDNNLAVGFSFLLDTTNLKILCKSEDICNVEDTDCVVDQIPTEDSINTFLDSLTLIDDAGTLVDLSTNKEIYCTEDSLFVSAAWLCANAECTNALTSDVEFGEIAFYAQAGFDSGTFEFTEFDIINLDESTTDLITDGHDATIIIGASTTDSDGDGIFNSLDYCPDEPNENNDDTDGDGMGDVCDNDIDDDGIPNPDYLSFIQGDISQEDYEAGDICMDLSPGEDCDDNCLFIPNFDQVDTDGDKIGDLCDDDYTAPIAIPEPECAIDTECAEGKVCSDSTCLTSCTADTDCVDDETCVEDVCVADSTNIEVIVSALAYGVDTVFSTSDGLVEGGEFTVKVMITPTGDLADHMVLAKVSYAGLIDTQFSDTREALTAGASETFEFTHEVPPTATGPMTISVFVWNNWLSTEVPWSNLMEPVEVEYEIK